MHVGSGPAGIAVTPGAVWVANSLDQTVSKIDPASGTVTATIGVGDGPSGIVAAKDGVWVSDEFDATLRRIDPQTARVDRTVHLGSSPRGMAVAGSGVWIAARPFPSASHRGGTLTVVDTVLPLTDPVGDYDGDNPTLGTAYDGLTAFRRSGGAAGLTLVPDLATRLPRPADGGTTYTFTLRRGIRYSNGNLVRASDFRRGIQRQLSFGRPVPATTTASSGRSACIKHPKRCDLSAGIVTDDATGTVTFRLVQADPDFLYKLALTLVAPAPPGTPDRVISRAPFLPGTGPYMISQVRPNKSVTLVRNPYFRQWSYAAQPAGYPSVIRYEQVDSQSAQESAVIAGRADLTVLSPAAISPSRSGTRPASIPASSWALVMPLSTPASRRSRTSRHGKPSTTPSIATGSCSSTTSPPVRPPRRARCSRLTSLATRAIAPIRPAPGTGAGMARTWRRRAGLSGNPARRTCR